MFIDTLYLFSAKSRVVLQGVLWEVYGRGYMAWACTLVRGVHGYIRDWGNRVGRAAGLTFPYLALIK